MNYGISWWIRRHAVLSPDRVALTAPERSLTYRGLDDRANRSAALLSGKLGLTKGDRLAIQTVNCLEWFELFTAAARLGVVVVPLNVRLTIAELRYQVQDAGCKALVSGQEFWPQLPALIAGTPIRKVALVAAPEGALAEARLAAPGAALAEPSAVPGISYIPYAHALDQIDPTPVAEAASGADPLLIVYTSGTTGKPKGAVLTHANLLYNALNNCIGLGLTADDVTLTALPLFHVGGIGLFATPALYTGAKVVLPRRFDPAESLRLMAREQVTVTMTVPTMMQAYIAALDRMEPKPDLSSVRCLVSGGAPCPAELIAAARERHLPYGQGFGMTETAPSLFLQPEMQAMRNLPPGSHVGRPGTVGKPVLYAEVRLLDDVGDEVPSGEVGEICARGGNLFAGYWNRPEATAKSFTLDGFFRSGDLAKRDHDGYFTIMGRKKEMLISGGENVYPLEVESVLGDHPAVAEVAVVGVPDAKWGEVPGAAVVFRSSLSASPEELTAWCRAKLAGYKTPKHWLFLPELPRTAIGKVIKPALEAQLQGGQ